VLLDELHATDHSTASTSTRLQPRLASHPTPRPGHGTPDRLPVRRLAVALARLPAIAFPVLLDTGAVVASRPVSPIERTEDPAELPVIEHRHSTGHATARPIGCRCAVSPSPWPACRRLPFRCCSTLAPSSLRGRLQRSRERRPGSTAGDRAPQDPDQATARPIGCRCAVWPSPWPACRRLPFRCCSTLAPSSLRGQFHRSRGRRPGRTAGDELHALTTAPPARATPALLPWPRLQPMPASRPTP
jgi:hypothetical protein